MVKVNNQSNIKKWVKDLDFSLINPNLKKWLVDTQILSKNFKSLGPEYQWSLNLLSEGCVSKSQNQSNSKSKSNYYQREIEHCLNGEPIVYAKVTMPKSTFDYLEQKLDGLKNNPIGESLLYNNPNVQRSDFEYLDLNLILNNSNSKYKYARRSTFSFKNNKNKKIKYNLLITEYFSEALAQIKK